MARVPSARGSVSARAFAWLIVLCAALLGGLSGYGSSFDGPLAPLGGPNGPLYDGTVAVAGPHLRGIEHAKTAFVAIDAESLSDPELAALPRALFQPVWSRLIDGLLAAGARTVAFDAVFAYSGESFRFGDATLAGYDSGLVESLRKGRRKVVLGQFPGFAPAKPFLDAVGRGRVGVLDAQIESDGRVRSMAALARLQDGRIALGFAALTAGMAPSRAVELGRVFLTPGQPPGETPTYRLAPLLRCLADPGGASEVARALADRIVVVGTTVLGEDEHRGPMRFMGQPAEIAPGTPCAPAVGSVRRGDADRVPGALLQVAAIEAASQSEPLRLAPAWLRALTGAALAAIFALGALQDRTALTLAEARAVAPAMVVLQALRSIAGGIAGPLAVGGLTTAGVFVFANLWLPLGWPSLCASLIFALVLALRWRRHRSLYRRLYETAGRYLPPAQLATLARSGFAGADAGTEREVTILFADVVGFTAYSNAPNRSASEVVSVANHYFNIMQEVIDRHGGCSDKFLGDGVLAFWNGLSSTDDHAARALAAAHGIVERVNNAPAYHGTRLSVRAVVCSGRVYVGDLGARHRRNFTIIGPAVNETFRLEKLPDVYGVTLLVGGSTAQAIVRAGATALPAGTALVHLDDVELKGFAGLRSVHALVPGDDPGLPDYLAAQAALADGHEAEASALFGRIGRGTLALAASLQADRLDRDAASHEKDGEVTQTGVK